jgi:hypothetical protein
MTSPHHDEKPLRRVNARKYPPPPADDSNGTFAVRFRIKGQNDGPVFQGQKIIMPCKGCNK